MYDFLGVLVGTALMAFFMATTIALGTSVGSKAITLKQAVVLGGVCEFLGSLLLGSNVANTIKKGILVQGAFTNAEKDLYLFVIGMMCVLIGAFVWLAVATYFALPVSTTHSIVAGVIGFSLVEKGINSIVWSKLWLIMASWVISPVLGGLTGFVLFYLIKKFMIIKEDPLKAAFLLLPYFASFTMGLLSLFVIFDAVKGANKLLEWWHIMLICFGITGLSWVVIKYVLVARMEKMAERTKKQAAKIKEKIRELKLKAGEGADIEMDDSLSIVTDVWAPTEVGDGKPAKAATIAQYLADIEVVADEGSDGMDSLGGRVSPVEDPFDPEERESQIELTEVTIDDIKEKTGVDRVAQIDAAKKKTAEEEEEELDLDDADDAAERKKTDHEMTPEEKAERRKLKKIAGAESIFVMLMVLTAIAVSFAHGANDVGNAIGPAAAVYAVFATNNLLTDTPIPIWILIIGGVGIVIGLLSFGYRVMKTVGEKIAKLTFSRGFAAQLGGAMTVLIATIIGIPISTTHTLIGAVTGVGLVDGRENVNTKMLYQIVASWLITIPAGGGVSVIFYLILKAILVPG